MPVPLRGKHRKKCYSPCPRGWSTPEKSRSKRLSAKWSKRPGLTAVPVTKLGDIKYAYVRTWGGKERVFKIVSFYLFRYESGEIDEIAPEMRIEVKRAFGFLWKRRCKAGVPRREGYGSPGTGLSGGRHPEFAGEWPDALRPVVTQHV